MSLQKPWLRFVQFVWIVLVGLSIGFFIAGLPRLFKQLSTLRSDISGVIGIDAEALRGGMLQLGIAPPFYAYYILTVIVFFAIYCTGIAFLIVRRKSNDWLVLLVSLSYVTYGTGYIYVISLPSLEIWPFPISILTRFLNFFCGVILYVVFFYIFPDGRFVPRWARISAVLVVCWGIYITVFFEENPFANQGSGLTPWGTLSILLILGSVVLAQIYRYLYVSNPSQRQQTKWAVFGFSLAFILSVAINLPGVAVPSLIPPGTWTVIYVLASVTLGVIFAMAGLLTLTIAIIRYRLWDIDRLIQRTLVYGILTGLLAATYYGTVVFLQSLLQSLTGQQVNSSAIVVVSTLIIAALFKPFRDRIQNFIDARFYQRKYNADQIAGGFAKIIRDEIDIDRLTVALIDAIQDSVQPEHVSLWLKKVKKA